MTQQWSLPLETIGSARPRRQEEVHPCNLASPDCLHDRHPWVPLAQGDTRTTKYVGVRIARADRERGGPVGVRHYDQGRIDTGKLIVEVAQ